MRILLVTATEGELAPLLANPHCTKVSTSVYSYKKGVDILVTGVGIHAVTYMLTKALAYTHYDLVANVGIAGAINPSLQLGEVVKVTNDCFADLGVDDNGKFYDLFALGFAGANDFPFSDGLLRSINQNVLFGNNLKQVNGVTVNTVHGEASAINSFVINYPEADVESMEGAAVFYVAAREQVPAMQIRSISNFVEPRNKANWNIPLAIESLNNYLNDSFLVAL